MPSPLLQLALLAARTRKLSHDLKFVLRDRMLATMYEVLDTLLEAKYAHVKGVLLKRMKKHIRHHCRRHSHTDSQVTAG
jgi:hypothetical protein